MQPKLKSKVKFADREVGEVTRIIVDPFSREVSHIVVGGNGVGPVERQIPTDRIKMVTEDTVELGAASSELERFPLFRRDEYVTIREIEIAHLEDHLNVEPGEVLVPVPELERDVKRRTFFTYLTHVISVLLALPLVFPVLKFLMKPMYAPYDNRWIRVGNVSRLKKEDVGAQFKFKRKQKEAFMPETEVDKNVWVIKASPAVLDSVYKGKEMKFLDHKGDVIWVNKPTVPYIAYSGKCPHLGCGYKWRNVRKLGKELFLCPCHLSFFSVSGEVMGGPAPRPLDVLPIQVAESGDIQVIDIEYKAGVKERVRLV
ncbi:MAG: ubiquinol-cytochrome c reductase iron-sulfur subunit [Nitrospirae bacterium]|nr:ubiquinol-cytochrome c reductase iron-sulfur subunit [Nitrospirota bacterium]